MPRLMRWEKIKINPATGELVIPERGDDTQAVEAVAPVIISASRATDIPAFYGNWFMDRIE